MATSKAYDDMVERIRASKPTKMTEAETKAEIERIQDGAKSSFEHDGTYKPVAGIDFPKKRRGRPPGSRNRPKGHNPT